MSYKPRHRGLVLAPATLAYGGHAHWIVSWFDSSQAHAANHLGSQTGVSTLVTCLEIPLVVAASPPNMPNQHEGCAIPHRLMAGRRILVPVVEVRILVRERFAGGIGIRAALRMRYQQWSPGSTPGRSTQARKVMNSSPVTNTQDGFLEALGFDSPAGHQGC